MRRIFSLVLLLMSAIGFTHLAVSQLVFAQPVDTYPSRSVTIIVPFPPGGGTDVGARLIAQKLAAKWGQGVVIENRGGAAGILGVDLASKAKPDGYTLLVGNVGTQSVNPSLYPKLPYNADTAFSPISMIAELPLVLLASPTLPLPTLKDVVAAAKKEPSKLSYASSGSGGAPHLATELLQNVAGIRLLHVPYKGGGPAIVDVMAGHVDFLFATVLESIGHLKSGKVKGIAVTSAARSPALPDMPTIAESGYAGFETGSWIGLLAPSGTPQLIVDKIAADVKDILGQAEVRQTLISQGATPLSLSPTAFKQRIDSDRARYKQIIQERGIKLE
jgi:tripartite-type tricarboxylate transporter receptor subunit TctC